MRKMAVLSLLSTVLLAGSVFADAAADLATAESEQTTLNNQMAMLFTPEDALTAISTATSNVTNLEAWITTHAAAPELSDFQRILTETNMTKMEMQHHYARFALEDSLLSRPNSMEGAVKEAAVTGAKTNAAGSTTSIDAIIAGLDAEVPSEADEIARLTQMKNENTDLSTLADIQLAAAEVHKKLEAIASAYNDEAYDESGGFVAENIDSDPSNDTMPTMTALNALTTQAKDQLGDATTPGAGTLRKAIADAPAMVTTTFSEVLPWMPVSMHGEITEMTPNVFAELLEAHEAPALDEFGHFAHNADGTFETESLNVGALTAMFNARDEVITAQAATVGAEGAAAHTVFDTFNKATNKLRAKIDVVDGLLFALGDPWWYEPGDPAKYSASYKLRQMVEHFRSWNDNFSHAAAETVGQHFDSDFAEQERHFADLEAKIGFAGRGGTGNVVDVAALAEQKAAFEEQKAAKHASLVENDKNIMTEKAEKAVLDQKSAFTDVNIKAASDFMTGCRTAAGTAMHKIVYRTAADIDQSLANKHLGPGQPAFVIARDADGNVQNESDMSPIALEKAAWVEAYISSATELMGVIHGAKKWLEVTKALFGKLGKRPMAADMSEVAPVGASTRLDPAELRTQWSAIVTALGTHRAEVATDIPHADNIFHLGARENFDRAFTQIDEASFTNAFDALVDQTPTVTAETIVGTINDLEKIVAATKRQAKDRQAALGSVADTQSLAEAIFDEVGGRVLQRMGEMRTELREVGVDFVFTKDSGFGLTQVDFNDTVFNQFDFNFDPTAELGSIYSDVDGVQEAFIGFDHRHTEGLDNQLTKIPMPETGAARAKVLVAGDDKGRKKGRLRQVVPEGRQKRDADVTLMLDKSGQVDFGNANWDDDSHKALNILGEKAVKLAPIGNGIVSLRSDIWIESDQALLPTPEFGKKKADPSAPNDGDAATDQIHRITFTSHVPREIRVLSGATLDLTAFGAHGTDPNNGSSTGEWYGDNCKQIVFDGHVHLIIEPGAKIRGPFMPGGKEAKGPVLYFNGNSKLIFEGTDNRDEVRWTKSYGDYENGCSDDFRCKILGVVNIWFNKKAECHIDNMALVGVEADHISPRTAVTMSVQRKAGIYIGNEDTAGGALQVGNLRPGGTGKELGSLPVTFPGGVLPGDESVVDIDGGGDVEGNRFEHRDAEGAVINHLRFEGGKRVIVNQDGTYAPYKVGDVYKDAGLQTVDAGGFMVKNEGARQIDFKIKLNGPEATFHMDREAFFGAGVGTVNKAGPPNGDLPNADTNPDDDPTGEQYNAWTVQSLHDVRNIEIDVERGYFDHNKIADGSDGESSLMAVGPVKGQYKVSLGKPNEAKVRGGGNLMYVSDDVGSDKSSENPPMPVKIFDDAEDLDGSTLPEGEQTYSASADTGKYSVLTPPDVMRKREGIGRATATATADAYELAGPAEESFLGMATADYNKFKGEKFVAAGENNFDVVSTHVNKGKIKREKVTNVKNNDGNEVDKHAAVVEGGFRGNGANDDGDPVQLMDKR